MKKPRVLTVLSLWVILAVAFVPARVSAAMDASTFEGSFAEAYFTAIDASDPCIVISAYVYAEEGHVIESGSSPEDISEVSVILYRFDNCNNEQLINAPGRAQLPAEAFQVDEELNSATLNTTVEVCDLITGNCFPASINVTWTGTGEVIQDSEGSYREAVTTGGASALGTSFTAEQAEFARIANVKRSGSLPPPPSSSALQLSLFTSEVGTGGVTLIWETETEASNLGFNLYRIAAGGDFVTNSVTNSVTKVNSELISALGNAENGATYQYKDRPLSGEYLYFIKNIDQQGVEHLRGQVEVEAEGYLFFIPALAAP